jgi:hypothetical protein
VTNNSRPVSSRSYPNLDALKKIKKLKVARWLQRVSPGGQAAGPDNSGRLVYTDPIHCHARCNVNSIEHPSLQLSAVVCS